MPLQFLAQRGDLSVIPPWTRGSMSGQFRRHRLAPVHVKGALNLCDDGWQRRFHGDCKIDGR